jgi:hypothetical protein
MLAWLAQKSGRARLVGLIGAFTRDYVKTLSRSDTACIKKCCDSYLFRHICAPVA